jgi:UDP-glucose 4-epimerase
MQEEALAFVSRTRGLAYNVLRLANPVGVYGRSRSQGLVTAALRAAAANIPLTLFGDGSHVRDVFDADDAADAIVLTIADRSHPAAVWNIGSGVGVSNMQIIKMVERVVKREISLDRRPPRAADVPFVVLDTTRARDELGWSPSRRLEDTIDEIWHTNFVTNPS